ncbi:hypothetical protein ACHAO4_010255 [Trichoderma viride]
MRFTAATVVSLLAGSAIAAPTDMNANQASDMSADASSIAKMSLADMFSERQMAVLKVLSEHQQELGMSQEEMDMMDAFMAALHEAGVNVKRQLIAIPTAITALAPPAINATALGSLRSAITALNGANSGAGAGAASGAANTAVGSAPDLLSILKNIPGLAGLLGGVTGTLGGATSGLGSATSGLGGLTGGLGGLNSTLGGLTGGLGGLNSTLGGLTGGLGGLNSTLGGLSGGLGRLNGSLGGLTGGLGGLTGGLGGLCGGVRRGGLLGGILLPGIL